MQWTIAPRGLAMLTGALIALSVPATAQTTTGTDSHDHSHDHGHAHDHAHGGVADGYFDDAQITPRDLSDWAGDWQSVYPLLRDGTLDPVMAHKAESGDKTAEEYRAYYETGYATGTDRILIEGDSITFFGAEGQAQGRYEGDGYEVLTYEKGNRGVRFIFEKIEGDEAAPGFIQFSDHRIAPEKADHYHLYWGDDRAALLDEVTNWPTYYPADLTPDQIVAEMTAH